jgi:F-type H+-transporting ATPase subunit a
LSKNYFALPSNLELKKVKKILQAQDKMSEISENQITNNNSNHSESHGEKHSPLAQFEVKKIVDIKVGNYDLSFTNSALYMVIATFLIISFMIFATRKKSMVPSRLQTIAEGLYNFTLGIVKGAIGDEGMKFFPLAFTIFTFILICNCLGMTPYSFTATSQIIVTFSLAMIAFTTVTIFAIIRNGIGGFLHMFLPSGVPKFMAPLIFAIEFFSFLIKPITLSVRLFANMVAGHVLLKVVAGFIISLGVVFGIFPFLFSLIMTGFELFVAVLQAYIFAILVCVYLGEVTKEH